MDQRPMDEPDEPGFRFLATDGDDSRWRAHQDALDREAAARAARWAGVPRSPDEPYLQAPVLRSRFSPLFVGGGLAVFVAVLLAAPLLLPRSGPGKPTPARGPSITRKEPASTPIATGRGQPCYVNGVSVGALLPMDCAARNEVASAKPNVGLGVPSRDAVSGADTSRLPVERRAPNQAPTPPPPARLVQAPPPARAIPPIPAPQAPPHPTRPPPVADSAPYADRLDDSALATIDAQRELSRGEEAPPSPAESAEAAGDFYTALGAADGARAASFVVPEKRNSGPLSARAIDRFYSSLQAPLRITNLRPLDNHTVAVRYQFVDPNGVICSGASEVATAVRGGRVLVQSIRTHGRC